MTLGKRTLRSEEGKPILTYLKNERGFSDEVIDRFDIGYCPTRVNHETSGRIITPIYDEFGNLVVLSTRHFDRNSSFKFWHETFEKRMYLYGLNHAKESIYGANKAIVVEGEFDVCAFHSSFIPITVGICGSAFSLFQISLLLRYCSEIYMMFDGDEAGRKLTEKVMKMYKENDLKYYGVKIIPVNLPDEFDPDDFLFAEGKQGVISKLKKSREEFELINN